LATLIYRSVGPSDTTDLNSTGRTVAISGTTATFSGAMPDNIGVGNVLQYQVTGTYYVAFITGRTSPTAYTVTNAAGGTPQAASAGTTVSVYRAYTSLSNAESGSENTAINAAVRDFDTWSGGKNLVNTNEQWNVACYANGTTADTSAVTVDGWTTGTANYIRLYTPSAGSEVGASQRHAGKWDNSKYHLQAGDTTLIDVREENVRIDGLQLKFTSNASGNNFGIWGHSPGTADLRISDNIIIGTTSPTDFVIGIVPGHSSGDGTARVWNNIIYNFTGPNGEGLELDDAGTTAYVYNNTVYGCTLGMYNHNGGTLVVKNNLANGNATDYGGSYDASSTNNLSGDGTAPGSNARRNAAVVFVDAANRDLHLSSADNAAREHGADLSADAYLPFSTDIDGQPRPLPPGGTWDIGADESADNSNAVFFGTEF
jgi:hypothetical protein